MRAHTLPDEILQKVPLEEDQYGVIVVDQDSRILLVTKKAGSIFGYAPDELTGQSLDILLPKRYRTLHAKHTQDFHSEPRAHRMGVGRRLVGLCKDGTEINIEIGLNTFLTGDKHYVVASVYA